MVYDISPIKVRSEEGRKGTSRRLVHCLLFRCVLDGTAWFAGSVVGSPQVKFSERKLSLVEFLTSVCAIVGGVFTVSSLIDGFLYHGTRAIRKKMEIGKLS